MNFADGQANPSHWIKPRQGCWYPDVKAYNLVEIHVEQEGWTDKLKESVIAQEISRGRRVATRHLPRWK